MKKLLVFLVTAVLILSLAGCSGSDNGGKNPENGTDNVTTTVAPTEEVKNTATPEVTATITPTPTEEPVPTETVTPDPKPTAEPTAEPTPEPVKSDEVLKAYDDFLLNVYMEDHYDESFEFVKYALGFINEDDIPELFVTDGDIHAYGTKVYTYVDGKVVAVGEFGQYGGFGFTPRKNNIYSFYYGMGVGMNTIYSMNPDGTLVEKATFMTEEYGIDPDTEEEYYGRHYIGDEEVSGDVYEAELSKYYFDDVENWNLEYGENFVSFSDTTYNRDEMLQYLLNEAINGNMFGGYVAPEMEAMVGEWELVKVEIDDSDHNVYGSFDNSQVNSVLSISGDFYADYWLSAWVLKDGEDSLFHCDYAMPMTYLPMAIYDGVENDDYSIRLETETEDTAYYMVMFTDSEGVETLELCEYYGMNEETGWENHIYSYYHRVDTTEPKGEKHFGILRTCPELTRNDGTVCYQLEEYLWITWDTDPEIIAAYGFAPDLDGYDYEIAKLEQEPLTVYVSQYTPSESEDCYTCYEILDKTLMQKNVDSEEFYNAVADSFDGIWVEVYIEEGTDIANFISERYTG